MIGNIFKKFFEMKNEEQLKAEKELKSLTVDDVVRTFEIKSKMENKMEVQKENLAENIEQPTEEIIEDAPVVSEETEVVDEQPKSDEGEIEPSPEPAVETEELEEKGQEEPLQEESVEELQEIVEEDAQEELPSEEPQQEPEGEEPVIENEQSIIEKQPSNEVVVETKTELAVDVVKPLDKVVEPEDKTSDLLKQIEQLKAEKAEQEIAMQKMNLAKEIEQDFAGVPGRIEDKVEVVYEIRQSTLSEQTKQFVLDSLKSLSSQNLKDCKEIGYSQEIERDEIEDKQAKVQQAIQEHGLTSNQAFLYVNGDRTLTEAKRLSEKVRNKK